MRTFIAVTIGLLALAAADEKMPNTLTAREKAEGWRLLFDGQTTNGWRGYRQSSIPDGWKVVDHALTLVTHATDIVTADEFADFELTIDWNISPGGNSGVLYRVTEDDDVSWKTAPEYQVIDNAYKEPLKPGQLAGANYDMNPPSRDVTRARGCDQQRRRFPSAGPPSCQLEVRRVKGFAARRSPCGWRRRLSGHLRDLRCRRGSAHLASV